MNTKGIPYTTEWLEYPDVEPVSIKYGAAPTGKWPDGTPKYTLPMIYDPNTQTALSESVEIAKYLDKTYPSAPAVFPEASRALQVAFMHAVLVNVIGPYTKIFYSRKMGLNPPSEAYWDTRYPTSLAMSDAERAIEIPALLRAFETGLGRVGEWFKANGPGKENLIMGENMCLADFQLAGILVCARNLAGEESEIWQAICTWQDGKWKRYLEQFLVYAPVSA